MNRTINEPISEADRPSNPFEKCLHPGEHLQKMGGTIQASSDGLGKGTTFEFTVSFRKSVNKPSTNHKDFRFDPSQKILIVDDNPVKTAILKKHLENLGFTDIETKTNAQNIVSQCVTSSFNIVFMDVDLGDANGSEIAQNIREWLGKQAPKIISCSANPNHSPCFDAQLSPILNQTDIAEKLLHVGAACYVVGAE